MCAQIHILWNAPAISRPDAGSLAGPHLRSARIALDLTRTHSFIMCTGAVDYVPQPLSSRRPRLHVVYHTYTHMTTHTWSGPELALQSEDVVPRGIQSLPYRLPVYFAECVPFYRLLHILGIPRLRSAFCRLHRSIKCMEHNHSQHALFTHSQHYGKFMVSLKT